MNISLPELFKRVTSGVYVIGVGRGERQNAFTAAWVMQVSYTPLLLALSINPKHRSFDILKEDGAFSVNVLGKGQSELAARFGQPASAGKIRSEDWRPGPSGIPLLRDAIANFECQFIKEMTAGDHVLVVARVINGELLKPAETPMLYRETASMDGSADLFPTSL